MFAKAYAVCVYDKHSKKRVVKQFDDFRKAQELVRALKEQAFESTAYIHYNNSAAGL